MAFAPSLAKKWHENLSVEELKAKYEELKKNYLNSSNDVNNNSTKIALEELLKEKTGKEYSIEPMKI